MKNMGIVQGSPEMAVPLVVGKDTVYVHTDIQQVPDEEGNMVWQYHEIQYEKDEYIKLMAEQSNLQDNYLLDVDYRLSLVEMGANINDL